MTYDSFLSSIKRILHQLHQLSTWSKNLTINHQTETKQFGFPIALASGGTASRGKRGAHPQLRCHGSNTWKGPGAVECGPWDLHQTHLLWKHVSLAYMMHIQSNVYLGNFSLFLCLSLLIFLGPYVWHVSHLHPRRCVWIRVDVLLARFWSPTI